MIKQDIFKIKTMYIVSDKKLSKFNQRQTDDLITLQCEWYFECITTTVRQKSYFSQKTTNIDKNVLERQ